MTHTNSKFARKGIQMKVIQGAEKSIDAYKRQIQ